MSPPTPSPLYLPNDCIKGCLVIHWGNIGTVVRQAGVHEDVKHLALPCITHMKSEIGKMIQLVQGDIFGEGIPVKGKFSERFAWGELFKVRQHNGGVFFSSITSLRMHCFLVFKPFHTCQFGMWLLDKSKQHC